MTNKNKESIVHLYGLMMEFNYFTEEVNEPNVEYSSTFQIEKHISAIRLRTTKSQAQLNKSKFELIKSEISRIKSIGASELKKLIGDDEALKLQPLFRNFEKLTAQDKKDIEEDEQLIQLIRLIKERIDNRNDGK